MQRARGVVKAALALAAVLIASTVAGCSSAPDPDPVAERLAKALSSGAASDVVWVDDAPTPADLDQAWAQVFEPLGEAKPKVSVAKAVRSEGTTAVTLAWDWELGVPATTWSYTTSATLSLVGGEWQARWSPNLLAPSLVTGEQIVVARTQAERGRVLGADDQVLVEARPVARVGIDKTLVDEAQQDAAARALAAALAMDPQAYADRVKAGGPKQFVEAITVRLDDPTYDLAALGALDGVNVVSDTLPLAPYADFARPVLGKAGVATAELVDDSDGAVVAGDITGASGLQRQYDALLRGTPGWDVQAVAADGTRRLLFHSDPVPGQDLRTTIDLDMQKTAEALLEDVEPAAAIVAIRPSTGDIVAVASGPGGGGLSTATVGQYAPGSTFKIVSGLALLRAGYTLDQTVECSDTVNVDGKQFSNVPGYPASATGSVSFTTAFANSCNTVFVGGADQVSDADLAVAARSLGLDPASGAGCGAFLGSVPEADATSHAAAMIGQGKVLASPLGMATVTASVQAGRAVEPRIVVDAPAATTAAPTATAPELKPLTEGEVAALRTLMHAVATDGTAATVLAPVLSDDLLAKTGTAEVDTSTANRVWMVAAQGDLAVAVFVEAGVSGTATAGPIMVDFLQSVD